MEGRQTILLVNKLRLLDAVYRSSNGFRCLANSRARYVPLLRYEEACKHRFFNSHSRRIVVGVPLLKEERVSSKLIQITKITNGGDLGNLTKDINYLFKSVVDYLQLRRRPWHW